MSSSNLRTSPNALEMSLYGVDSSEDDSASFTSTKVLLGYASTEPTDDVISQLGGYPVLSARSSSSTGLIVG